MVQSNGTRMFPPKAAFTPAASPYGEGRPVATRASAAAAAHPPDVASRRLKQRLWQLVNRYPVLDWVGRHVYLHPRPNKLMPRHRGPSG